jgi:hypothetical protein
MPYVASGWGAPKIVAFLPAHLLIEVLQTPGVGGIAERRWAQGVFLRSHNRPRRQSMTCATILVNFRKGEVHVTQTFDFIGDPGGEVVGSLAGNSLKIGVGNLYVAFVKDLDSDGKQLSIDAALAGPAPRDGQLAINVMCPGQVEFVQDSVAFD